MTRKIHSAEDFERAAREAAWARPQQTEHVEGLHAAVYGLAAIIVTLGLWTVIPDLFAWLAGIAAAYVVGYFDSRQGWKRYWKAHEIALDRKIDA